jgi:prolyl 4-hydroxylase
MHSVEPADILGPDLVSRRYREHMVGCYRYYDSRQLKKKEKHGTNGSNTQTETSVVASKEQVETEEVVHECDQSEQYRVEMNRRQPMSARNYTSTGFAKIRAPTKVFQLLKEFWEHNRNKSTVEKWHAGQIYVNHWDVPSLMVPLENSTLEGGGDALRQHVWDAARTTIERWTGQRQVECSLYGIRIYQRGALLVPHVDRAPLVASAIINVDQDLEEPWPLEVIGHDGISRNVTMRPGDMVLYESHSIIHGRPFPLKGNFMANVFIHFEPIGPLEGPLEYNGILPPYIVEGSPDAAHWRQQHPEGHKLVTSSSRSPTMIVDGQEVLTALHLAAAPDGARYDDLVAHLDANPGDVVLRDPNGWTALAEAIRTGHVKTVRLLLERGAAPDARIGPNGEAGSLLWLAVEEWGERHEVAELLQLWNATVVEPHPGVVVEGLKSAQGADDNDATESDEDEYIKQDEEEEDDNEEEYFEGFDEYEDDDAEEEEEEVDDEDWHDNDPANGESIEDAASKLLLDEETPRSLHGVRSDEL